ncbi:MAG: Hsp20 family protein [Pseudomonadota bacterium]
MARTQDFSALFGHPLLVGFGRLETALTDAMGRGQGDNFPPYNVEQLSSDHLVMTFALAGFRPEDLDVVQQGRHLLLSGQMPENKDASYIHRGIAARGFRRRFLLADGYDVTACTLKDGLLRIDVVRPDQDDAPRTIPVTIG